MADADSESDEKFVEVDGLKFKEDPENEGQPLLDEEGKNIPFEEPGKPAAPPVADEEPPVRRSAKDYIIARKDKKIEKLTEEDELDPTAEAVIDRKLEPVTAQLRSQADDNELQVLLQDAELGPGAKAMEADIRKYMDHPAYKDVAVKFIYLGLAARKIGLKDRAKEKEDADEEAKGTETGGHTRRPTELEAIPDVTKMSDAAFDKLENEVRSGPRA